MSDHGRMWQVDLDKIYRGASGVDCGRSAALEERHLAGLRAVAQHATRWQSEDEEALPEEDAIKAAHPTRTGHHDLYAEAMRLVGARRSKGGLVELVNWLLWQIKTKEKA